jgi:hypothetical protein
MDCDSQGSNFSNTFGSNFKSRGRQHFLSNGRGVNFSNYKTFVSPGSQIAEVPDAKSETKTLDPTEDLEKKIMEVIRKKEAALKA